MSKSSDKAFFKITELSGDFNEQNVAEKILLDNRIDDRTRIHLGVILWQVKAQLAIAQQLSIISKHLGEIVEKSK